MDVPDRKRGDGLTVCPAAAADSDHAVTERKRSGLCGLGGLCRVAGGAGGACGAPLAVADTHHAMALVCARMCSVSRALVGTLLHVLQLVAPCVTCELRCVYLGVRYCMCCSQ